MLVKILVTACSVVNWAFGPPMSVLIQPGFTLMQMMFSCFNFLAIDLFNTFNKFLLPT